MNPPLFCRQCGDLNATPFDVADLVEVGPDQPAWPQPIGLCPSCVLVVGTWVRLGAESARSANRTSQALSLVSLLSSLATLLVSSWTIGGGR